MKIITFIFDLIIGTGLMISSLWFITQAYSINNIVLVLGIAIMLLSAWIIDIAMEV